jgi:hypothetical protein
VEDPLADVPTRTYSRAEQQFALDLMADAVRRGEVRTLKQLEKLGFLYRPAETLAVRRKPAAPKAKLRVKRGR